MTTKVLLLAFVCLASASAKLLGEVKCTYGPSYWCSSLAHAKECSAMPHCIAKAWRQPKQVKDDSPACVFCQDLLSDVKKYITSNKTEADIKDYAYQACKYMPDDFSQQTCKNVFDHYFDELEQLIENNFDPKDICVMIELCGAQTKTKAKAANKISLLEISKAEYRAPKKLSADTNCSLCQEGAALIAKILELKSVQNEVLTIMKQGCSGLTYLKAECEALIDQYGPDVIKAIGQQVNNTLCKDIHVCPANGLSKSDYMNTMISALKKTNFADSLRKLGINTDECTLCEEIFNYIKIIMGNKEAEQEVQQFLDNEVCPRLGNLAAACKEVVDTNLPTLWSELLEKMDTATICKDLGLCSTQAKVSTEEKTPHPEPVAVTASPQCILCEFVMEKLDSLLSKNATEEEIEAALEKVCSIMPSTIQSECDDFIQKYLPVILKALSAAASPGTVCRLIGLCSGVEGRLMIPMEATSTFGQCTICKLAMEYLQESLKKSDTQDEILEKLASVCLDLAGDLQKQCHGLVYQYGPKIIDAIANDINPDDVCQTLGICSNTAEKADGLVHLYNSNV